jgi:hypothetical protein
VAGGTGIHYPWPRVLEGELVYGSNQPRLIPCLRGLGDLKRSEGGVSLRSMPQEAGRQRAPPAPIARCPWPRVEAKPGPRGADLPWRLGLAATALTTATLALAFCPVSATVALGLPVSGSGKRSNRSNRGAGLGRG